MGVWLRSHWFFTKVFSFALPQTALCCKVEKKNACCISNSMQQAQRKNRSYLFYKLYYFMFYPSHSRTAGVTKIKEPPLNATKNALCPAPVLFTEASCKVWLLGGSLPCAETPVLTNITKRSECLVRLQARSHTAPCRSSAGSLFIETYTPHSRCRRCRGAFSYTESAAWFLHSIRTSSRPAGLP